MILELFNTHPNRVFNIRLILIDPYVPVTVMHQKVVCCVWQKRVQIKSLAEGRGGNVWAFGAMLSLIIPGWDWRRALKSERPQN